MKYWKFRPMCFPPYTWYKCLYILPAWTSLQKISFILPAWTSLQKISFKVRFLSESFCQMCFSFFFYPCYKPSRVKYLIHIRYCEIIWRVCQSVYGDPIRHRFLGFPGKGTLLCVCVCVCVSLSLSLSQLCYKTRVHEYLCRLHLN